ncbi:MAG: SRPBCC domain-containing protein [bacterium]
MENKNESGDNELIITRVINAPRDLVFKSFTESERLKQWWGPKGFTMKVANLDLRPGGAFHYSMVSPDGIEMWGKFVYREIITPEKIVFFNSFSDKEGNITRHPLSPNWPLEIFNMMTFTELDSKTILTLVGGPVNATEDEIKTFDEGRKSMMHGFAGTFDQLDQYLENPKF